MAGNRRGFSFHGSRVALVAVAVAAAVSAGCGSMRPDPYAVRVSDMGYMVKMDDSYRAIPVGPADRAWFDAQTRALFDQRKARATFIDEGNARYPGYDASWRKLAELFAP